MSITILNEIDKAEALVKGLNNHLEEVKRYGITSSQLKKLETHAAELKKRDEEVDALRRQLTVKVRENNELLAQLKAESMECRRAIKANYLQPEWSRFGVPDKR